MFSRELNNANTVKRMADFLGHHLRIMKKIILILAAYLETLFEQMSAAQDTVRRLFIVAAASYDDYLRRNNNRLAANPYTDLLYLETSEPLDGKGSTLYLPYYGRIRHAERSGYGAG